MDKRVMVKLNGGRVVEGTLRGFDPFMNLVVDEGMEVRKGTERVRIGVCVSPGIFFWLVSLCISLQVLLLLVFSSYSHPLLVIGIILFI